MTYKTYRKKTLQLMTPWVEGFDMEGVSVSDIDKLCGSPKDGDMIAIGSSLKDDKWLISKEAFEHTYEKG